MSGNTNIVIVEGRLTKDPTYMKTKTGRSLCKFSIANNKYYYSNGNLQKEVYYFDLVAWGYNADKAAVNLFKGKHVLVNGELRQNIYTSKDGSKKNSFYILVSEINNLDKKSVGNIEYTKTANNQRLSDFIEENLEEVF
ncbi:single-stranded DNA-binding protein [Brachyspira murdochii]|uniref:Single-stranded DNA-binding protein n=1 Tax=Brachyspira murdochii (strain ATCC 51284 / DSM 12563 / 56-150) TaxID=526224 RepID=D5UAZ8_BRAM5|nr:single-stranded DNA-binding protein [Brachyspira murdochii]ADG71871.1 single-strand binding protein [Brachyspira murdochii DSM 12563]